eukprot:1582584-Rhodomonas_salina.1
MEAPSDWAGEDLSNTLKANSCLCPVKSTCKDRLCSAVCTRLRSFVFHFAVCLQLHALCSVSATARASADAKRLFAPA